MSGFEIAGVVLGAAGVAGLIDAADRVARRCRNFHDNKEDIDDLLPRLASLRALLQGVRSQLTSPCCKIPPTNAQRMVQHLQEAEKFFAGTEAELKTFFELSRARRLIRATRIADSTSSIAERLRALDGTFMTMDGVAALAEMSKVHYDLLVAKLDTLSVSSRYVPPEIIRHCEREDSFTPHFDKPRNPLGVVLNLGSDETLEGKVKAAVLRRDDDCVGAVGSAGMGGVGKTCALKGIACDDDISSRYVGGVYYMTVGKNATPELVVQKLAALVKYSGGRKLGAKMEASVTVDDGETEAASTSTEAVEAGPVCKAATLAASWFAGQCCLFICDDIWETDDNKTGYFDDLCMLVDSEDGRLAQSGSCLLFSTRNHEIGDLADAGRVEFSAREPRGAEAQGMLCAHAKLTKEAMCGSNDDGRAAFEFVLDQCAGLPLALAVAGRAIAESVARTVGHTAAGALQEFGNDLRETSNVRLLIDDFRLGRSKYPNLSSVLAATLKAASVQSAANTTSVGLPVEEMLWALCVMPKKAFAPLSMLRRLWGLEKERDAANVARLLHRRSLAVEEVRDGVRGITLHDLVLEFCVRRERSMTV
jgi:NB-ARC domain